MKGGRWGVEIIAGVYGAGLRPGEAGGEGEAGAHCFLSGVGWLCGEFCV